MVKLVTSGLLRKSIFHKSLNKIVISLKSYTSTGSSVTTAWFTLFFQIGRLGGVYYVTQFGKFTTLTLLGIYLYENIKNKLKKQFVKKGEKNTHTRITKSIPILKVKLRFMSFSPIILNHVHTRGVGSVIKECPYNTRLNNLFVY